MKNRNHKVNEKASDVSAAIQKFNFHGDMLDIATTSDGNHWVVLADLCEPFEIVDVKSQADKVKSLPWAGWGIFPLPSHGGIQRTFCLNIRSVAGWLFTLNAGKVAAHLRDKLAMYQRECADVLADHFLGKRGALPASMEGFAMAVAPVVRRVVQDELVALRRSTEESAERRHTEALAVQHDIAHAMVVSHELIKATHAKLLEVAALDGTIRGEDADKIRDKVAMIVQFKARMAGVPLGQGKIEAAIRADIYADLFSYLDWGRKGQTLATMPAAKWPLAKAFLDYQLRRLRKGSKRSGSGGVSFAELSKQVQLFADKAERKPN